MTSVGIKNSEGNYLHFVHLSDDRPEAKRNADSPGTTSTTRTAKRSLPSLRGYLLVMGVLSVYNALQLSGLFGHHLK